ncbi:MAG: ABC transporter permease subunit [Burkholderiales bacterium]|nr:ABC transporter permease subunit [Anaerolineae bacterium]
MRNRRDRSIAFLMLLPTLILLGIFVYYFIGKAVDYSLSDWGENPDQPALAEDVVRTNIGLRNYDNLMTDIIQANFRNSLTNTFFFTVFFVAGCTVLGLFLAILLDQKVVAENFFRTVFLFPMALSFVVTGTIWRWLLQPGGGINLLPTFFGLEPIQFNWLTSQETWLQFRWQDVPMYLTFVGIAILAMLAVRYVLRDDWRSARFAGAAAIIVLLVFMGGLWNLIWPPLDSAEAELAIAPKGLNAALVGVIIAAVWQMSGYVMAIFTAGIRGIPDDLREAARVDGCTEFSVYRYIVLPQLSPFVLSAMIVLGHISLKIFDLVFAMSGPDNARTGVPGILVYTKGFRQNSFATASAVAVIMLCLVAVIIVPYIWTQLGRQRARE